MTYAYWARPETGAIYRLREGAWEVKQADGSWVGLEDISEQAWNDLERIDAVRAGEGISAAAKTSAAWGEVIAEIRRTIRILQGVPAPLMPCE